MTFFILAATAAFAALVFTFAWRLASRRREIPCPAFLSFVVELDNPFFRNNNAGRIIANLGVSPGVQVLDAGCGPGRLTIPLAKAVGSAGCVVAVDLQRAMLEKVRLKAERAKLANIEYLEAPLGSGRLPLGRFDRAVLITVLGEIPDRAAALGEIFRALKPGGILAVTEVIADPHFQRRKIVRALALSAGFRDAAAFGGSLSFTLTFERPVRGEHG